MIKNIRFQFQIHCITAYLFLLSREISPFYVRAGFVLFSGKYETIPIPYTHPSYSDECQGKRTSQYARIIFPPSHYRCQSGFCYIGRSKSRIFRKYSMTLSTSFDFSILVLRNSMRCGTSNTGRKVVESASRHFAMLFTLRLISNCKLYKLVT